MFDPITMDDHEQQPQQQRRPQQSQKSIEVETLESLISIEHNTKVIKGWISFFGIVVLVVVLVYLFMTFIGVAAALNLFSGIIG